MRYVQNLLLVVGAAAFGAASLGVSLFCCVASVDWRIEGHPACGMHPAFVLVLGGGALGAGVGLITGITWIVGHRTAPWKPGVWIGVILGIVAGLDTHLATKVPGLPEMVSWFEYWPITVVLMAALGMAGGILACSIWPLWDRDYGDRR